MIVALWFAVCLGITVVSFGILFLSIRKEFFKK
jgi:hypothetical protein